MSRRVTQFLFEGCVHGGTRFKAGIAPDPLNGKLVFLIRSDDLQRSVDPEIIHPFIEIMTHVVVDA